MSAYKSVPVHVAKAISEQYDKSMVVVLAYDPVHELTHTTTYGVSAFDKENAAAAGEKATVALGGDLANRIEWEDFHSDMKPALFKESLELLRRIVDARWASDDDICQAERILHSGK